MNYLVPRSITLVQFRVLNQSAAYFCLSHTPYFSPNHAVSYKFSTASGVILSLDAVGAGLYCCFFADVFSSPVVAWLRGTVLSSTAGAAFLGFGVWGVAVLGARKSGLSSRPVWYRWETRRVPEAKVGMMSRSWLLLPTRTSCGSALTTSACREVDLPLRCTHTQ